MRTFIPGIGDVLKAWDLYPRALGILENLGIFIPGDWGFSKIWGFLTPGFLPIPRDICDLINKSPGSGIFYQRDFGDGDFSGWGFYSWDEISHQKAKSDSIGCFPGFELIYILKSQNSSQKDIPRLAAEW